MPTDRKQNLIVFSDAIQEKLTDDAKKSSSSVQDVVREIVSDHYQIKNDRPIKRGRPVKSSAKSSPKS